MKSLIESIWYAGKFQILAYFLLPLSGLFYLLSKLSRISKSRKSVSASVPVVVVGNISVGGTGKTPVVIAIVQHLQQQGLKPAVVSRGFGGKAESYPYVLSAQSTPEQCGDEPLLIYQACACPVVVAPKRNEAIDCLLSKHDVDVIVSDDGLQHYAMARELEIAVIDGERGVGNGFCLPAGPLRELTSRLNSVDFIVQNGKPCQLPTHANATLMQLVPQPMQALPFTPASEFNASHVYAVAGIGNPERFFTTLSNMGLTVEPKPFADHHLFGESDLLLGDDKPVVMTAKDAVKCNQFSGLSNHWYLPVAATFSNDFLAKLTKSINEQINIKRKNKK